MDPAIRVDPASAQCTRPATLASRWRRPPHVPCPALPVGPPGAGWQRPVRVRVKGRMGEKKKTETWGGALQWHQAYLPVVGKRKGPALGHAVVPLLAGLLWYHVSHGPLATVSRTC